MGQSLVTPKCSNDVVEFVNLPKEAMESLWTSYNLLVSNYGYSEKQLSALFKLFDNDANGLIDALEMFITIALISGMDSVEKLYFAFNAYDFDSVGSLTYDEVTLLFRSMVKGLGKVCPSSPVFTTPTSADVETYASLVFNQNAISKDSGRLTIDQFKVYCTSHPVLASWLKSVASFPTSDGLSAEARDKLAQLKNAFPQLMARSARRPRESSTTTTAADFRQLDAEGNEISTTAAVDPPAEQVWYSKTSLATPDELPAVVRYDPPEDVIESVWINGINTAAHRAARYSADNSAIVFTAANHLVSLKKGEETGWVQTTFTQHSLQISCSDLNTHRGILVTGDAQKVVIWDAATNVVLSTLPVAHPVVRVDLNHNGSLLLVVFGDVGSTVTLFNISNYQNILPVFTTLLLVNTAPTVTVNDARFTGTSSMFAVGDSNGLRFFVEEGGSFMGPNAMRAYEERLGLYQGVGKPARGVAVTAISRFENVDELVSGTEKGQLLVWHGRTCAQLVEAHRSAVSAVDFNAATGTLLSAAVDGTVNLYKIVSTGAASDAVKKGPKITVIRSVMLDATFDILRHPLYSHVIRSAVLSADGNRVLVTTAGAELLELTARLVLPSAEELEAAAAEGGGEPAAEGEEGAIPSSKGKLGDDVHGGPIVSGHFAPAGAAASGVISCVARIPGGNSFATCGADMTIRLWSNVAPEGATHVAYKVTKSTKMDTACIALDASTGVLAVTLSAAGSARTGSIHLFSLPDLTFIVELKDAKTAVSDLKFSPDGNTLCVANTDGTIYVYNQAEAAEGARVWSLKGKIPSITAGQVPQKIDFSTDGLYVRTIYQPARDYRVWDVSANLGKELTDIAPPPAPTFDADGELIPVPPVAGLDVLKALTWVSHSCPYNWDTKGALALNALSESLNAHDRFNHLLLSALNDGSVAVDRVPSLKVVTPSQGAVLTSDLVKLRAHLGAVSSIAFIEEGAKLVTVGSNDGILRVWKVNYDMDEPEPDIADVPNEEEEAAAAPAEEEGEEGKPKLEVLYDSGEEEDLFDGSHRLKEHLSQQWITNDATSAINDWAATLGLDSECAARDSAMALAAPPSLVPNDELVMDWVYGCSVRGTRGAVQYSKEGTIVYPAGTLGVVYDKLAHKQILAMPHNDEITCLDVHTGSGLAATAHKGVGNIQAVLWSTSNGAIKRSLDCGEVNGISAIKFSNDGKYLIVACQDEIHTNIVFSVADGRRVAQCKGGSRKTLNLTFSQNSTETSTSFRILQGGVSHFKFLTLIPNSSQLLSKTGAYGAGLKKHNVVCATALPLQTLIPEGGEAPTGGNEFALGMSDGSVGIVARGESKVTAFNPVHKGPVTAITFVKLTVGSAEEPPTYKIVTAGINGVIKILDGECQPLAEYNLYAKDYGLHSLGRVRGFKSLCVDKLNRKLLYSTAGGEVGEIDVDTGADVNAGPLVSGHFRDQLHVVSSHPLRQECLSVGDDQTLRIWNLEKHTQATKIELPDIARAACYAPNGHIIAVGLGGIVRGEDRPKPRPLNGRVLIVSYLQGVLRIVHTAHNAGDTITSVLFSPDGSKLFAASLDHMIYMYDALDNFNMVLTLQGHTEGVAHIDITEDGKYLVSMGTVSEMVVWDLASGTQVPSAAERFEVFATVGLNYAVRQGTFGMNAVGIFPSNSFAQDVWTLNQSKDQKMLVTGDKFGNVKLFRNPACEYFAPFKRYAGHSPGGVSKVSFTVEDQFLVTCGRSDRTVIQWKVRKSSDLPDPKIFNPNADVTPVAAPEEDFESSFTVLGITLSKNTNVPSHTAGELQAYLKSIVGVGALSNAATRAQYCGQGEILTSYGRALTLLQADPTAQSPLMMQRPILLPSYSSADNQLVSTYAVSNDGRFALVGHASSASDRSSLSLISVPAGVPVAVLAEHIPGGVVSVAFSFDGRYIACIGGDEQHSLTLYTSYTGNWDDGVLLYSNQLSAANINLVTFLAAGSSFDFVTAGEGHIRFWNIVGQNVTYTMGSYGDGLHKTAITTVASVQGVGLNKGQLVTGDVDGNVWLWLGATRDRLLSTHAGTVTAITSYASGSDCSGFVTASNDKVVVWSTVNDVTLVSEVEVEKALSAIGWTSPIYLCKENVAKNFVTSISTDPKCSRLLLSFSSSLVLTVATDSMQVQKITEGHGSQVLQVLSRPTDVHCVVTLSSDNIVRFWDTSRATVLGSSALNVSSGYGQLAGFVDLAHVVTSAVFLNSTVLLVGVTGSDTDGTSGAIVVIDVSINKNNTDGHKFNAVISNKVHNVGTGAVHQVRISPNGKQMLACSADGSAYLYDIPSYLTGAPASLDDEEGGGVDPKLFQCAGMLLAHPSGAAVVGADFSTDNRYVRTFGENSIAVNGKVAVNFFDFEGAVGPTAAEKASGASVRKHAANKINEFQRIEELKNAQWSSVSSPAATEARGLCFGEGNALLPVESIATNNGNTLIAAGYADGTVRINRYPAYTPDTKDNKARVELKMHAPGKVLTAFTGAPSIGTQQLVTVSQGDGAMMVWHLTV